MTPEEHEIKQLEARIEELDFQTLEEIYKKAKAKQSIKNRMKIPIKTREKIRELAAQKIPYKVIKLRLGISIVSICKIVNEKIIK